MNLLRPSFFLGVWILTQAAAAQDTLRSEIEVIANFSEARALASDPQGLIYVVSASEIVQLDTAGTVKLRLDGTNAGVFGELSDIDPGNGLIWVVADAEKGSLLRFSKELLHLETIRVPRNTSIELGRSPRLDLRDEFMTALGQPIAVATAETGALFAVDGISQHVLKWDSSRRLERIIGEFGSGSGQLQDPVSMAANASSLFVADRAMGVVKVYDHFGGHLRDLKAGPDLRSIFVTGNDLWVVFPQKIWIYNDSGSLFHQWMIPLNDPLIGAVPVLDHILFLTSNHLLRAEI